MKILIYEEGQVPNEAPDSMSNLIKEKFFIDGGDSGFFADAPKEDDFEF